MTHHPFGKEFALLVIAQLLVSLACNALSAASPAASEPQDVPFQRDVTYGSGPFNLPDARVGLSDLSSYLATLTLSFDGTRQGQAEIWSETYLMRFQTDTAVRQLTIERSGDLADLEPVFMAEANETAYERSGAISCTAYQIETGNSLGDRIEPAGFLNYVIGADEAGSETVNDIAATHYTFDQHALGQQDLTQSTGEMWVAVDGGYIVKYVVTTKGSADYFGEGIEGTLSYDYELAEVNQPVEFNIPSDCPPGVIDAPRLEDASNVVSELGLLTYATASSVQDAAAFYQQELSKIGWQAVESSVSDTSALLAFEKDNETMFVSMTAETGSTSVLITQLRTPE